MNKRFSVIEKFVEDTRDVLYLREVDRLLIIRPNKLHHCNDTAFALLAGLYRDRRPAAEVIATVSKKFTAEPERLEADLRQLMQTILAIMKDRYNLAPLISTIEFDPGSVTYPILSEIALTYRCQNRCDFCYASSPYRGGDVNEMTTGEVKSVIDAIYDDAHVPTISFTGGEPTLRKDLPELVAHASERGMRVNLITNGIRCADRGLVEALKNAGLNSAQVSLEAHSAELHDKITGHPGAWEKTVAAVENLKGAGVHTHTNTTICRGNRGHLIELARFVKERFAAEYLSMNMIIATGIARDNENINIGYSSIGAILKPLLEFCEREDIRFVWYSPTPFCIFNPLDHNLGSKSCACIKGLLSVNPAGDILPCSSYDRGVGNLLKKSFNHIWNSDQALYYRERRYTPPVCRGCELEKMCSGGCPLYWENAGSFRELEDALGRGGGLRNMIWKCEKKLRVTGGGISGLKGLKGKSKKEKFAQEECNG